MQCKILLFSTKSWDYFLLKNFFSKFRSKFVRTTTRVKTPLGLILKQWFHWRLNNDRTSNVPRVIRGIRCAKENYPQKWIEPNFGGPRGRLGWSQTGDTRDLSRRSGRGHRRRFTERRFYCLVIFLDFLPTWRVFTTVKQHLTLYVKHFPQNSSVSSVTTHIIYVKF